jgi:hypothetical protein
MNDLLKSPIIIFGTGRSGTTIISEVVFQHKDLAWPSNYQNKFPKIPEINYLRRLFDNKLWRLIGRKKQLYGSALYEKVLFKPGECYAMWRYLAGESVDFSRGFLLSEKAEPERKEFIRQYFAKLVEAQGKTRLAFKFTGPPRMGYLLSIFPDAVFIHIKREPIPTISSLLKIDFWRARGRKQLWWTGPYSSKEKKWAEENRDKPELMTAFQLKKIYWADQVEISKYKPTIMSVNYEDFTAEPEQYTRRMLEFCGLPYDKKIYEYLDANPIVDRNKPDENYFDENLLKQIYEILDWQTKPVSSIDN